jgi:hypothetical protein
VFGFFAACNQNRLLTFLREAREDICCAVDLCCPDLLQKDFTKQIRPCKGPHAREMGHGNTILGAKTTRDCRIEM